MSCRPPLPSLLSHCLAASAWQGSSALCLSHLMLTLLAALPSAAGALSVHAHSLSFEAVNHFSFDEVPNEEETVKSRSAQLPLNVVQLAQVSLQCMASQHITGQGRAQDTLPCYDAEAQQK